jgi:hypothetical protein
MLTPQQLLDKVKGVVEEQEDYTQTLMFERLGLRWGEVALTAGAVTGITLSQPFEAGVSNYQVWRQVYDATGEQSEVVITDKTNTGFNVEAPTDCTFKYLTTLPNLTI